MEINHKGKSMSYAKFMAAQLRQPSGFFGRHIMVHLLNRINVSINNLALEALQLNSHDHVLEVGFGGGDLIARMSRVLAKGRITGVDFSQDAVEACTKRFASFIKAGMIDLHCANVVELPFETDTFTKACTVNTIYFWPDPLTALRQIHSVLKEKGKLVVCFSPRQVMEKRGKVIHHGFMLYEPEEVTALLTGAGFRNVQLFSGKNRLRDCVAVEGTK
jgi:ubiquinone/menaquinone biosynthesis C-methylase UbiE